MTSFAQSPLKERTELKTIREKTVTFMTESLEIKRI